jgi:UDPglucose 6-dehydrogenase
LNGAPQGGFSVVSNPEFLREGSAVTDFLYPDRIVVGADDAAGAAIMQAIYQPLTSGSYYAEATRIPHTGYRHAKAPMVLTNAKSAELIKHASNAFLAMKISFINAVANISEAVGADIQQVCEGIGSDSRIGPRFLNAGIGYGGSCFPKDVQAFRSVAEQCNYDFSLLTEVMRINSEQRARFLKKIRSALWTLRGKRLGVLGLAFKADTDDVRESPAIAMIEALVQEGAQIKVYDPAGMANAKKILSSPAVTYVEDEYETARGSDALLILTEWAQFASLDLRRIRSLLKYPIMIDGRNLYEPATIAEAGFIYHSIGRATVHPVRPEAPPLGFAAQSIAEISAGHSGD